MREKWARNFMGKMGKKCAGNKTIDRVSEILRKLAEKGLKPGMVNPHRIEKMSKEEGEPIDHNQAEAALEVMAFHPGKPSEWDGHILIRSVSHPNEWWLQCDYSPMTHIAKNFEERVLIDLGLYIPPLSEFSKFLDGIAGLSDDRKIGLPRLPLPTYKHIPF